MAIDLYGDYVPEDERLWPEDITKVDAFNKKCFQRLVLLDHDHKKFRSLLKSWLDIGLGLPYVDNNYSPAAIGYCFGGMLAHIAASELKTMCVVSYYGGLIAEKYLDKSPQCPIIYHFGEQDFAIPMSNVELIKKHYPEAIVHTYKEAGHGFNCEMRNDYHKLSANLAFKRTLTFLNKHMEDSH